MENNLFEQGKFYTQESYGPGDGRISQLHEAIEVHETHVVLLPLTVDPKPFAVFYNEFTDSLWEEANDYQLHRNWKRARLEKTQLLNEALNLDEVIDRVWGSVNTEEDNNEVNL